MPTLPARATRFSWPSLLVWTLHAACVAVAVAFAALFVLMATSLDPMEIITAGAEPWKNALAWALAVPAVLLASAVSLALWHWRRLRWAGAAVLAIEIGGLIWAGSSIYNEYF